MLPYSAPLFSSRVPRSAELIVEIGIEITIAAPAGDRDGALALPAGMSGSGSGGQ
jgi:hypothetical protein